MTLPEIILAISPKLEKVSALHALWLEGSYATRKFGPDSDIDVWLDVDDNEFETAFEAFKTALENLGILRDHEKLNFYNESPKLAKAKFYLVDKTNNQRIELDLQPHSRNFVFSPSEHTIKVIFDKDQTIRWRA